MMKRKREDEDEDEDDDISTEKGFKVWKRKFLEVIKIVHIDSI